MREELVKRMRCLADAIPMTASPETTLTTASVTINCIIEKPRWAVGFFFRVRIVAFITPPVRLAEGLAKLSRGPRSNDHASHGSPANAFVSRRHSYVAVLWLLPKVTVVGKRLPNRTSNGFCGIRRDCAFT